MNSRLLTVQLNFLIRLNNRANFNILEEKDYEKDYQFASIINYAFKSLTAGLDFSAYAAEGGYCGENVGYCYYDSGTIRIYGTGEMHDGCRMGSSKIEMKNAVIETGVTSIGDETFYNCTSLTSITIPE